MRPVSVTVPTTAQSRPHFVKTAMASGSRPASTTMSIRSWLSESMIS